MMQYSFFLCKYLHPADVGAVSDRPRAWCSAQRIEISILAGGKYTLIHDNRPYEFYCRFCVFCNTPFLLAFLIQFIAAISRTGDGLAVVGSHGVH